MAYKDFKKYLDWVNVWSGKWSLNTDTNLGWHWTVMDKVAGKPAYKWIIYTYQDGITDCWVREADKANLGKRLVSMVKNISTVKALAGDLKNKAESVFSFIKSHSPRFVGRKEYLEFWNLAGEYYLPHLSVKYIVDYFSSSQLKKFLPALEEARLYSEPVFRDIENFMEAIAETIAKKAIYKKEQIFSTTKDELQKYFQTKFLPDKKMLTIRYSRSAILFDRGRYQVFAGDKVDKIEKILLPQNKTNIIKGSVAYKGKATGLVKVVIDPKKSGNSFKEGEILVTGMTRPEFLPMMKKAAAFITDAGGILSHAAIVARELKKPCIIGTHIATRILKNGDLVEVDADKGIIKILKKV